METDRLFSYNGHFARDRVNREILFLAFLLESDLDSPTVVAAGASRSNLFFSRMFGASAKPNFGLKPRNKFDF